MDTTQILAEIDAEIESLQQAKAILTGTIVKRGPGRPKGTATPVKKEAQDVARRPGATGRSA